MRDGTTREPGELDDQRLNTLGLLTAYSLSPEKTLAHIDHHLDLVQTHMEMGLSFEDAWAAARGKA